MSEEYEQFMKSGSKSYSETTSLHTAEISNISYVKIVDVSIPFLSILLLVLKYTIAFFIAVSYTHLTLPTILLV